MLLRLGILIKDKLASCVMKPDGSNVCCIVFEEKTCSDDNSSCLSSAVVWLVDVLLPDNENRTARCLYDHNHDSADEEIVQFSEQN